MTDKKDNIVPDDRKPLDREELEHITGGNEDLKLYTLAGIRCPRCHSENTSLAEYSHFPGVTFKLCNDCGFKWDRCANNRV